LVVLAGLGFLAGHALADSVPVPSVPTVTVAVPTVLVPLPTIPKLPAPVLPAPVQPAPVQAGTDSVSRTLAPSAGGSSGGGSSSYSSGSSAGTSSSRASRSRAPTVKHLHSSRTWIATSGPKRRRTTTLTFVLPRATRVIFTVNQVSPTCRGVGRFTVVGHAGLNRVRFAGRVGGKQLGPGTYRISVRTLRGRLVRRVRLVVVEGGAPSKAELAAARASNVCSARRGVASATTRPTGAKPEQVRRSFQPKETPSASGPPTGSNKHSGAVLASSVEKTARAIRPFLVALLALSILLLGLASLPAVAVPDPRVNDLLARHRVEIAGFGVIALVSVAMAFLLA
jgi:hypothetical protein